MLSEGVLGSGRRERGCAPIMLKVVDCVSRVFRGMTTLKEALRRMSLFGKIATSDGDPRLIIGFSFAFSAETFSVCHWGSRPSTTLGFRCRNKAKRSVLKTATCQLHKTSSNGCQRKFEITCPGVSPCLIRHPPRLCFRGIS